MVFLIRIYQVCISSFTPRVCRFEPTCSQYAIECLREHNIIRALFYAIKRILKCHPLCDGGYDPVPKK
ncbi:membrane protein insertion efficiency factor YidD [bacterium]|nr:membrane protein insertion efficiency factor YidD [bacterium]MBU1916602.1 membrane protein insertion efficiency factor YidD [bacterium]